VSSAPAGSCAHVAGGGVPLYRYTCALPCHKGGAGSGGGAHVACFVPLSSCLTPPVVTRARPSSRTRVLGSALVLWLQRLSVTCALCEGGCWCCLLYVFVMHAGLVSKSLLLGATHSGSGGRCVCHPVTAWSHYRGSRTHPSGVTAMHGTCNEFMPASLLGVGLST
jgi:hypothetical protein